MRQIEDFAIIGAGPYGLSIAAHLAAGKSRIRTFGMPMQTWRTQMPDGMRLKSEGYASTLYDPGNEFPISRFCQENGIPYADVGLPVARKTFADYGQEFARRYVPSLEERNVTDLRPLPSGGFELAIADGETVQARRVICAIGITFYAHVAPVLASLPPSLMSHSSAHHDLSIFKGRTVAVVGGGASAADCAALLADGGATTHLLTRRSKLAFHEPPRVRTYRERFRSPRTTIGSGWKSVLYTQAPLAFHRLPVAKRVDVVSKYLGPAPCWFVREQIEAGVNVHNSVHVKEAAEHGGRVLLTLEGPGGVTTLEVDHVIAATGYKVNLGQLPFLNEDLRGQIRTAGGSPALSSSFESSVKDLFFVGASAANSFGPLVRFACGAEFTARRLARQLH
jgi:cation diffusion facilitator CzcD-associated flavoprotein CzcO